MPEPDPRVVDVIHGVLRAVPPQPWQSYMRRSSYAAALALTDLGLCKPEPSIRKSWWRRLDEGSP